MDETFSGSILFIFVLLEVEIRHCTPSSCSGVTAEESLAWGERSSQGAFGLSVITDHDWRLNISKSTTTLILLHFRLALIPPRNIR